MSRRLVAPALLSLVLATALGCVAAAPASAPQSGRMRPPGADAAPSAAPTAAAGSDGASQESALRAGAVDDNADFAGFLRFLGAYGGQPMRALDVSRRREIRVVDADERPVLDASVTVSVGEQVVMSGKTYAGGRLLFHPGAAPGAEQASSFVVRAAKGQAAFQAAIPDSQATPWTLKLDQAVPRPTAKLDVLFLVDATGSMGGEIGKLQSTITAIATRIRALPQQPAVRFGLVAYRDKHDEYVTKKSGFTADAAAFQAALDSVQAGGGDDYPEHLEAGLAEAVSGLAWGDSDTVRLTFLVGDAPPHVDYADSAYYTESLRRAVEKGIKLYTVSASGLSAEGEYVFRQLAQFTLGQYIFILRGGDAEAGGGPVSHTVDQYAEGRLDDIVVGVVRQELEKLGP